MDSPMSTNSGGYTNYSSRDDDQSYISGSTYGANTTPYGLATPHTGTYGSVADDHDIEMHQDDKKHIKMKQPDVKVTAMDTTSIDLVLSNCDLSFANALRRICIAEVPTMAFDFVDIEENSSVLDDEFIAHRLGLIPLVSNEVEHFKYGRDCDCEDGCPFCMVEFTLNVVNNTTEKMNVTQRHLKNATAAADENEVHEKLKQMRRCRSVTPCLEEAQDVAYEAQDIVLVKLGPSQRLSFRARATKGIGKEHAKFTPVSVVGFVQKPRVVLSTDLIHKDLDGEQRKILAECCPSKVFSFEEKTQEIDIEDADRCTLCNECTSKCEEFGLQDPTEYIKISTESDHFKLHIETTGALDPDQVVRSSLSVLKAKLKTVKDHLKQLKSH